MIYNYLAQQLINTRWLLQERNTTIIEFREGGILYREWANDSSKIKHRWEIMDDELLISFNQGQLMGKGEIMGDFISGILEDRNGRTEAFTAKRIREKSAQTSAEDQKIVSEENSGMDTKHNINILDKFEIPFLYHITHKSNVANIFKHGILAHKNAHNRRLITDIANDEVNACRNRPEPIFKRNIHEYAPLYFNPRNPMLYAIKDHQDDLVILAIDRTILLEDNVVITDGNAASSKTNFFRGIGHLDKLKWNCIQSGSWTEFQDGKRVKCSEILVFPKVMPRRIVKVFCNSIETRNYLSLILKYQNQVPVEIDHYQYF